MKIKKIIRLFVGTNNLGKLREIKGLLPKNLIIHYPKMFKLKSPKENGKSFRENSLIKAKYFSNKSKLPCISDDSGLAISILDGAPGIKSARWGGTNGNFNLAIKKVYNKINQININWDKKKIRAKFICALTIYRTDHKYITSIGIINGIISKKKRGKYGFGYDPIFIPDGSKLTFGQMNPKKKYKIDHRAKAFKKIKKFL